LGARRTADPSTTLGMTKGRVVTHLKVCDWERE
jgi:hypothetical protein